MAQLADVVLSLCAVTHLRVVIHRPLHVGQISELLVVLVSLLRRSVRLHTIGIQSLAIRERRFGKDERIFFLSLR